MNGLSTLLVERRIATQGDVEEAGARRVLYGGDLVVNLLELVPIDEPALSAALAEATGLPAAPVGELERAATDTLRLVPPDVALRHGLYPMRSDKELTIAVAERLPKEVEQELTFALGLSVLQCVTNLARIRQALSRDYGLPLDRRFQRLIAKLDGRPDPAPSVSPSPLREAPRISALPKPPSVPVLGEASGNHQPSSPNPEGASPAGGALNEHSTTPGFPSHASRASVPGGTNHASSQPIAAAQIAGQVARRENAMPNQQREAVTAPAAQGRGSAPKIRPKRHRGPYTAAQAESGLRHAKTRDDVVTAFFDFVAQYFEYTALFVVHSDMASGRDAHGPGTDHEAIRNVGVPLDLPSSLAKVRDSQQFSLNFLDKEGLDRTLASDLGRAAKHRVFLLPVSMRSRCVLMLYGDEEDRDVELTEIGDVLAITPLAVAALEHVILQRKLEQKRAKGKGAASAAAEATGPLFSPPAAPVAPKPVVEEAPPAAAAPAAPVAQPSAPSAQPMAAAPPRAPALVTKPQRVISVDAAPSTSPAKPWGRRADPAKTAQKLKERVDLDDLGKDEDWDIPDDPLPARVYSGRPKTAPPPVDLEPQAAKGSEEAPTAPAESGDSDAAPQALESVLVQSKAKAQILLEALLAGDSEAEAELLGMGVSALSAAVAEFPGPVKEPEDDTPARASECGPLLRLLVRMGPPVAPFLVVRTNDTSPQVRRWATLVLGEVGAQSGVHAITRRLTDESAPVRGAALEAARRMLAKPETRGALADTLREAMVAHNTSEDDRLVYLEAVVELRIAAVIPALIELLEARDATTQSVEWALTILTGQSFGANATSWRTWWSQHGSEHRIEWLIEALVHKDIDIRRAASLELKALTKRYFGYYEDLPTMERKRAQGRYRRWWESEGRSQYT